VIGVTRQNLLSTVELLREHSPYEKVRPGCPAERDNELRAPAEAFRQAVRPADDERQIGDAIIPPFGHSLGQRVAAQIAAGLVKGNDRGASRQARFDQRRLAGFASGTVCLAVLNLMHLEGPFDPARVVIEEVSFDAPLKTSDRDDMEVHLRPASA